MCFGFSGQIMFFILERSLTYDEDDYSGFYPENGGSEFLQNAVTAC